MGEQEEEASRDFYFSCSLLFAPSPSHLFIIPWGMTRQTERRMEAIINCFKVDLVHGVLRSQHANTLNNS